MSKLNQIIRKIGFEKAAASGAAALAAISVLLIPVDILSNAVAKAGLDTMFAPLSPPIGAKARIGLALLVAGMVFGVVLTAMNLLDAFTRKRPAKARKPELAGEEIEDTPTPPRVRRRDAHPDAPTRAILSPARELGEPDAAAPTGRLRRFRPDPVAEAAPMPQVAAPWPESDPVDVAPDPIAGADDPFLEGSSVAAEPEPEPEPEPVVEVPQPSAELEDIAVQPEPVAAEPAPEPQPPAVAPEPRFTDRRTGERRQEPRTGRESIAELMTRLERALGTEPAEDIAAPEPVTADLPPVQDLAPEPVAAAPVPEPVNEPANEGVGDDRLRSAIDHLRRVASRA